MLRRTPRLVCSFCGLGSEQVAKLIAGPNVHICGQCVELCERIIANESGASFAGEETIEVMLQRLSAASAALDSMSELLHQRVAELRAKEVSWQQIASALSMSRQAAWERFH